MTHALLSTFFEEVFVPLQLDGAAPRSQREYRAAIAYLTRSLGRPATLADLNRPTLETFVRSMVGAAFGAVWIRRIRSSLLAMWRYAASIGLAAKYDPPPRKWLRANGPQRAWDREPAEGTLLACYRRTFRPALRAQSLGADQKRFYDYAITKFHDWAGYQVKLGDVTPEVLETFRAWLPEAGIGPDKARMIAGAVARVVRSAAPQSLPIRGGGRRSGIIGAEPPTCQLAAPSGAPGTLLHFWETTYRPQRMLGAKQCSIDKYYALFRAMRKCFGRDLRLDELNDQAVAQFLAFLKLKNLGAKAINSELGILMAVWRLAARRNVAPAVADVERLKEPRHVPDAWSLEEMARIIEAAGLLKGRPIGGIPLGPYMRALLLVGYYTALRRRALMSLRPCDVDLAGGWLDVPPEAMKNATGQRFRLGGDALEALRAIWDPQRDRLFPGFDRCGAQEGHFKAILRSLGIPKSRLRNGVFHKLRRTTVTHTAALKGMAAAVALAGHSSAYLTRLYIDPRFLPGNDATEWLPSLSELLKRQGAAAGGLAVRQPHEAKGGPTP